MPKPSRRRRSPATTAVAAKPVTRGSVFLAIRRALFDGSFAKAAAEPVGAKPSSVSIGIEPPKSKPANPFAAAFKPSSPTK